MKRTASPVFSAVAALLIAFSFFYYAPLAHPFALWYHIGVAR